MRKLTYINSKNEKIELSNAVIVKDAGALFGRNWSAETSYNKIIGFTKKIINYSLTVTIVGDDAYDKANKLLDVFEKDIILQKAGRLICDDWYIDGYITKSSNSEYNKKSQLISLKLTFTTDLKSWIKESLYVYRKGDSGAGAIRRGLGYEYDYPYDFLSPISSELLINENYIESPAIIKIYGAVIDPKVAIGGHVYQVFTTLLDNEYLIINAYDKTITKVGRNGVKTNEFANRNKDSYIFEKIPVGANNVIITPEANVDIILLNERGEPEWT